MKFTLSVYVGIAIFLTIASACNPSQSELAAKKLKSAEALIARGDTLNSLLCLDSIPKLYPDAASERHKAVQITNGIYTSQLSKQRQNLSEANKVISSLINEFKPEKGEFDKYTSYIPNRQVFDKSWSRSFIQVYLNEKGDLTLASNYYGEQWLNHTSFKIVGETLTVKNRFCSSGKYK